MTGICALKTSLELPKLFILGNLILPIISQVRTSLVNRFREGQHDQILPGFLFVHYFANQSDSDGGKRKRPELRKK